MNAAEILLYLMSIGKVIESLKKPTAITFNGKAVDIAASGCTISYKGIASVIIHIDIPVPGAASIAVEAHHDITDKGPDVVIVDHVPQNDAHFKLSLGNLAADLAQVLAGQELPVKYLISWPGNNSLEIDAIMRR